jgi:glycosyltransferase involved in cell wall biosynthesis/peptidoglycan/xylan/chitin deacetylase (PgdA/CDA1 family)
VVLTCNYSPWSAYRGGGQKSTHMLASAFARAGISVCVVYSKAAWEKMPIPAGLPYAVRWAWFVGFRPGISSPLRFLNGFTYLVAVRGLAGPRTLVIGNGDESSLLWLLRTRGRLVFASRNTWDTWLTGRDWSRPSTWLRAFFKEPRDAAAVLAARRADQVVCTSSFSLAQACDCFGIPAERATVIPNGLDPTFQEAAFGEAGQRGVLFFGRLAANKGAGQALEAWLRLPEALRLAHPLTFAGDGPLRARLQRQAAEAGAAGQVRFVGWLNGPELATPIIGNRLVALPSLEESFGNAILETLATGQELVTTTACSIPEIAGSFGILVPPGDVAQLAAGLERGLTRVRDAQEIARQRRYFLERFSWDHVAQAYLKAAEGPAAAKPIRLALRYDDCSALSPGDLEDRILAACARTGVPITFGVIPEHVPDPSPGSGPAGPDGRQNLPLPADRISKLTAASRTGLLEIALHGCTHRSRVARGKSEFDGVDPKEQDALIARGLELLKPLEPGPRTFIPPWNTYDGATLEALERHGIRTLSAAAGGPWKIGPRPASLAFLPSTCVISEIRAAVAEARRNGGGVIVPYFHPYDFKEMNPQRGLFTFAEFDSALDWLAAQPDIRTATLGGLSGLPEARPRAYSRYSRWHSLAPSGLERILRPAYRVYPFAAFPVAGGGLWLRLSIMTGYLAAAVPVLALARFLSRFLSH